MPNLLEASFHRRQPVRGLQKITVKQKFGNHSAMLLDYRITNHRDYLLPSENTPTTIRFGKSPIGIRTGYGYVNHYETVSDETDAALTRLVVMGTSKVMNASNPGSWQGQTRSAIVRDFAVRHKLRSVVHTHPYVMDNWATGTRTDFQSLKALADEVGYRLWVDGATLWFLDPKRWVRSASSIALQTVRNNDLRTLEILGGSEIPGELTSTRRRVQYGLDYRTNEFFEATSGDPSFPTQVADSTVNTYSEAQFVADAAERKERDYYVLKAAFTGNARVTPGSLIRVDTGRVTRDQQGIWLVTEVNHEISRDDFSTYVVATKGSDSTSMPTATTTRDIDGLAAAVVRDNRVWEAALQEHVNV